MERYRTSGMLDESALNEVGRYFISSRFKWAFRILAVIYVLFGLLLAIARSILAVPCFVLAVIFALSPRLLAWRFVKINAARLKESYTGGIRTMESYFDQDSMVIISRNGGENVRILYSAFFRVAETEHYFFLSTRAGQFCLVYKNFLTTEERAGFIPFLKEKCPKIKVVR